MVRLAEIDIHNFDAVVSLTVLPAQRDFVASNAYSIAQAYVQSACVPLAVYAGNDLVGFCMYCMDEDDHEYWIYRLMIDQKSQRRGYGRETMRLLIERIRADREHHRLYISFEPANEAARLLYTTFGFRPDGRVIDGEVVYVLEY